MEDIKKFNEEPGIAMNIYSDLNKFQYKKFYVFKIDSEDIE